MACKPTVLHDANALIIVRVPLLWAACQRVYHHAAFGHWPLAIELRMQIASTDNILCVQGRTVTKTWLHTCVLHACSSAELQMIELSPLKGVQSSPNLHHTEHKRGRQSHQQLFEPVPDTKCTRSCDTSCRLRKTCCQTPKVKIMSQAAQQGTASASYGCIFKAPATDAACWLPSATRSASTPP